MGYYIAIFTIPDYLGLRDAGRYYLERGRRVGYFAMPNDGDAKASFYFASKKLDYGRGAADQQKALLRDTFAGMKWETRRLLDLLDVAPDFYFDSLSQVKMESWTKGRVALLGDAASCASPMSGMGTSLAVVGAYILARELKNASHNYAGAFHKYETTMRAFAEEAQKMAEGVSWFIPETRLKLWLSNTMWSWMPKSTLRKLMVGQPAQIATMVKLT
jgi:2-polyprenyl-6-methoxyphenol hydroxylase-like FAD-dependent oxidoreductase